MSDRACLESRLVGMTEEVHVLIRALSETKHGLFTSRRVHDPTGNGKAKRNNIQQQHRRIPDTPS